MNYLVGNVGLLLETCWKLLDLYPCLLEMVFLTVVLFFPLKSVLLDCWKRFPTTPSKSEYQESAYLKAFRFSVGKAFPTLSNRILRNRLFLNPLFIGYLTQLTLLSVGLLETFCRKQAYMSF